MHNSFKDFINNSKHYKSMLDFVKNTKNITPSSDLVFRFLDNDLTKLKYVILGMDPYPSTYIENNEKKLVATGRAFEVGNVKNFTDRYKQTSLCNIFKSIVYMKTNKLLSMDEIRKSVVDGYVKIENTKIDISCKNFFDKLELNGVMFLNASLTTEIGKSGAHTKIWESFINELIQYIVDYYKNIKWLIWGQDALNRVKNFVDSDNIYYTCHPATRTNNTFVVDTPFEVLSNFIL